MDSKSRLQLLAPPPLTGLPTSDGNSPTSGDSIVSPELSNTENLLCDSNLVGSRWFAHSNGLDALLSSKSITYNNDPFRFDDDLPSLFAKQVRKFLSSSMVGNLKLAFSHSLNSYTYSLTGTCKIYWPLPSTWGGYSDIFNVDRTRFERNWDHNVWSEKKIVISIEQ